MKKRAPMHELLLSLRDADWPTDIATDHDEHLARAYADPRAMTIEIRLLGAGDADVLANTDPDVFDGEVNARWTAEFLADQRHHLAVALDNGCVVGMASAVHYVHPDKPPELWVNEVGVAESHQGRGIGRKLLEALFAHGRALGCSEAWVLTEDSNEAARRLYSRTGGVESPALMYSFALERPGRA